MAIPPIGLPNKSSPADFNKTNDHKIRQSALSFFTKKHFDMGVKAFIQQEFDRSDEADAKLDVRLITNNEKLYNEFREIIKAKKDKSPNYATKIANMDANLAEALDADIKKLSTVIPANPPEAPKASVASKTDDVVATSEERIHTKITRNPNNGKSTIIMQPLDGSAPVVINPTNSIITTETPPPPPIVADPTKVLDSKELLDVLHKLDGVTSNNVKTAIIEAKIIIGQKPAVDYMDIDGIKGVSAGDAFRIAPSFAKALNKKNESQNR